MKDLEDKLFYRYYDSSKAPFTVSYDSSNKYGNGIYFIDNPIYYNNRYDNSRLVVIKPKFKNPLIFRNDQSETPNMEYISMVLAGIKNKNITNRSEFTEYLIKLGYDSLVIFEARGIYLILFSNDPELYEVISDKIPQNIPTDEMAVGGEISPLKFVSASAITSIKEIIELPKYKDLSETEGSILYSNWKNDIDISVWFNMDKKSFNTPFVEKLLDKGYLEIDYLSSSNDYTLSEKGKEFIDSVMNRYLTRLGVKKGTDLFPEHANIKEVDEKVEKLKKSWGNIGDKFPKEVSVNTSLGYAIVRHARETGKNPILSTEKPSFLSDIYREIIDTGIDDNIKLDSDQIINGTNFYKNTTANFNVIDITNPEEKIDEIRGEESYSHISEYGSKYFIKHGVVFRLADHWGKLDKCNWTLNEPISDKLLVLASCPLSKFFKNE